MKKYYLLWILLFMLPGIMINAQVKKSIKSDPVAQLEGLIAMPSIKIPSVKMVSIPMLSPESLAVGFYIKRNIEEARMRCPLLYFEPTLELEGKRNNIEEVGLEWKTENAFNGLYFDVERSFEDTLNFEKINFVWSKNSRTKEKYQIPDENDYEALSYYRVKLKLNDGNYKYSNIITLEGFPKNLVAVYPNPASASFWLNLSSQEAGNADFALFNSSGFKVVQKQLPLSKGFNREQINLADLPAGIYMIRVVLPDKQIRTARITKG